MVKFWDSYRPLRASWVESKAARLVNGWNVGSWLTCRFQSQETIPTSRLPLKCNRVCNLGSRKRAWNQGLLSRICTLFWTPGRSPAQQTQGGSDRKPPHSSGGYGAAPPEVVQTFNTLVCTYWSSASSLHYHSNMDATHFQMLTRAVTQVGITTIGERPEKGQSPMK